MDEVRSRTETTFDLICVLSKRKVTKGGCFVGVKIDFQTPRSSSLLTFHYSTGQEFSRNRSSSEKSEAQKRREHPRVRKI